MDKSKDTYNLPATYYDRGGSSTWDFIVAKDMNFLEGNIVKYVVRWRHKGTGLEDLEKAQNYLNRLIQEAKNRKNTQ